jgi:hypothetical protein
VNVARTLTTRLHRAAALGGTAVVLALLTVAGAVPATPAVAAEDAPEYTETKTLIREHLNADGSITVADTRTVTVTVDHTQSLRGRERVPVSWSGARPSAARANNPYGYGGMNQEYPVVILQCRGLDDPTLPEDEQLQPETCWTTTYLQRYSAAGRSVAVWQHDRYATEADGGAVDPAAWPEECGTQLPPSILAQHLLPFRAANETVFQSCNDATIAPESSIDAALPPADVAAFTSQSGTGEVQFEVRTETENESLGCSADVPCSIVVIPIMGISCGDSDTECRKENAFATGSTNSLNETVNAAVSPYYWWSESNWRNRFSVPLTFALPPDACDVLDDRAPVAMYGSELLNQASLQWAPAYCLREDRFKFQHNRFAEPLSLRLLGTGDAVAAFVSEPAESTTLLLGYAPVAVSGFGVAYVSDLAENAGELTQMRLTPRLLAKLLTQSYPATGLGRGREGLEDNPLVLSRDPEFLALNPTVKQNDLEVMATVLSLSETSDVMSAVTQYIAADAEAMAFIGGEPDPWGMVVNPAYKDIALPRAEWPMLDGYIPEIPSSGDACLRANPAPYFQKVASPVNSLRKVAVATLDAWPNVSTVCTGAGTAAVPFKLGRVARQDFGNRNMLGLVSLGDAERFGLRTAELRTSGTGADATFVAASEASMAAAVETASQAAVGAPFTIDRGALPAMAYPGTMIVHATARLTDLPTADAGYVAEFIRIASTEGQTPGSANGELPAGYLPITESGVTAELFASAQTVAGLIEAQEGLPPEPTPTPTPTPTTTPLPVPPRTTSAVVTPRTAAPLSTVPDATDGTTTVEGLPAPSPDGVAAAAAPGTTLVQSSTTGRRMVAGSMAAALAGIVGAPALWAWSTRRRVQ